MGSLRESAAMKAFRHKHYVEYTKVQVIVQSIIYAGNLVASMLTKDGTSPSPEGINNMMEQLRELLFPELAGEREEKAAKAKKIMEREIAKGPFKVEKMVYGKKR